MVEDQDVALDCFNLFHDCAAAGKIVRCRDLAQGIVAKHIELQEARRIETCFP